MLISAGIPAVAFSPSGTPPFLPLPITYIDAVPYLFLWVALGLVMFTDRHQHAAIFIVLSLAAAAVAGIVEWEGLALLVLFAGSCLAAVRSALPTALRALAWGIVVVLAVALGTHEVPWIHNVLVLDAVSVSDASASYTLHWNYDKGFAGVLLYAVCVQPQESPQWKRAILSTGVIAIVTVVLVGVAATAAGYTAWDPKLPAMLAVWMPANLLLTCVAEESFFRGLLQRHLGRFLGGMVPAPALVALVLAAMAFGAAHVAGGIAYVLLATLAGIGYGTAYWLTGRVEAGILVHFLLNLSHLVLFSYPFVA